MFLFELHNYKNQTIILYAIIVAHEGMKGSKPIVVLKKRKEYLIIYKLERRCS